MIITKEIEINTRGDCDIIDITEDANQKLSETGLKKGIVTFFVIGSTAALTTIEYEPGLLNDFPRAMEKLFPKNIKYDHDEKWHDGNGHSHIRASFLKPDITIPFNSSSLVLGTWQQLVFIDFDNRSRNRKIVMQIIGE